MSESDPFVSLAIDAFELARLLQTSTRTVWRLRSAGKLPAPVMVGSRPRWRREEIEGWLNAGCPDRASWEAISDTPQKPKGGGA
jgi:excisionase family DNA binding protein